MPIINLTDLLAGLPAGTRVLGVDLGTKTIGLALSDVDRRLASPYGSLARGKLARNAAEIAAIARQEGAGGLVVGLPLSMDGSAGPAAQAARDWAHALVAVTSLPAVLWDERLSTAAVQRILTTEVGLSRSKRTAVVDRAAAAWLLQAALDVVPGSRRGIG